MNDHGHPTAAVARLSPLIAIVAFCGGCGFLHPMTERVLDCHGEDLKVDHAIGFGFSDTWVAECRGATYDCDAGGGMVTCRPRNPSAGPARGMIVPPPAPPPYVPPPR